ncbi:MAG: hypothetical protein KTR30_03235 [Saprospiraceae bacterium]|nr:hypothetical protein [Saprospiraceae bacterium]
MILVNLLKKLSTRERTKFQEFVESPFFNKNLKIQQLCKILLAFAPDFDTKQIDKENIYHSIYGDGPYEELRLNNLISDLVQLLYDYLSYLQLEHTETQKKALLLEALQTRGLYEQIPRQAKRYQKILEKQPHRNQTYFWDAFLLHEELDQLSLSSGKRGYDINLQSKNDMLDTFYTCSKLSIACDMISRNTVVNAGYQCYFLEEIIAEYKARPELSAQPTLQVYYKTLEMLRQQEQTAHYYQLKDLLNQYWSLFPARELRILYHYALNYGVKKINSGRREFYREILELYKILLDKRILFKEGYLTQWTYINIVTAGIRLKEFNWTEEFINQYRSSLHPNEEHNVYTYNLAALYYAREDYSSALQLLHDVEFTDAFYHLSAKIIQLKSYYDLQETEAFFSLAEATRIYITRNRQLSEYQKRSNANFLKLATRLLQLRLKSALITQPEKDQQTQRIRQQLESKNIANKGWLQEALLAI